MADWDADSTRLQDNLRQVLSGILSDSIQRIPPSVEAARSWHSGMMDGLDVPDQRYLGRFRGEAGLEGVEVRVGQLPGVQSDHVAKELGEFEQHLRKVVNLLDKLISQGKLLSADEIGAVIDVCAWAHAEWVRIHPFANGNGRTARLWANLIAMRYGLPPFVRPRPRPGGDYGSASVEAMQGNWRPTVSALRRMYRDSISR